MKWHFNLYLLILCRNDMKNVVKTEKRFTFFFWSLFFSAGRCFSPLHITIFVTLLFFFIASVAAQRIGNAVTLNEIRFGVWCKAFFKLLDQSYAYSHKISCEADDWAPRVRDEGRWQEMRLLKGKAKRKMRQRIERNSIKSLNFVYFCISPLSLPLLQISSNEW